MSKPQRENTYLQQVLQEKAEVDRKLSRSRQPPESQPILGNAAPHMGRAIDYRVTGFWIWKSVIVPPQRLYSSYSAWTP